MKFSDLDLNATYTYADYLTWTFSERIELFKGKIFKMSPAPSRKHQDYASNLYRIIDRYLDNTQCKVYFAPFDVRLTKLKNEKEILTVVQPDISVICDKKKLDDKGCLGAPDLIIEILSPGNSRREMKDKYALYEENGVKEYWVVHNNEDLIQVWDLIKGKYVLRANYCTPDMIPVKVLKGLEVSTEAVFKE
jgi:Uma2 family endonuclease